MTGYESKKAMAQDKVTDIDGHVVRDVRKPRKLPQRPWVDHEPDGRMATQKFIEAENKKVSERYGYVPKLHPSEWQDKLAQPAQDSNWAWACNECGAQEFTSALSEADLDYLACSNCGGNEFHKEALAQTAQEQLMSDQIKYGMSVTQGGRRIDPMSIYKEPEQEPVAVVAVNQSGGIRMEYQDGSAFDISKHIGQRFYTSPPQPEQEPVAVLFQDGSIVKLEDLEFVPEKSGQRVQMLYTAPPQRPKALFPTMLRKMWSGAEVQAWLDENVNKENT